MHPLLFAIRPSLSISGYHDRTYSPECQRFINSSPKLFGLCRIHLRRRLQERLLGFGAGRRTGSLFVDLVGRWSRPTLQASLNSATEGPSARCPVESLVDVEVAGRLGEVAGIGWQRVAGILRDKGAVVHLGVELCGNFV